MEILAGWLGDRQYTTSISKDIDRDGRNNRKGPIVELTYEWKLSRSIWYIVIDHKAEHRVRQQHRHSHGNFSRRAGWEPIHQEY